MNAEVRGRINRHESESGDLGLLTRSMLAVTVELINCLDIGTMSRCR